MTKDQETVAPIPYLYASYRSQKEKLHLHEALRLAGNGSPKQEVGVRKETKFNPGCFSFGNSEGSHTHTHTHTCAHTASVGFLCDFPIACAPRGEAWMYFIVLFS